MSGHGGTLEDRAGGIAQDESASSERARTAARTRPKSDASRAGTPRRSARIAATMAGLNVGVDPATFVVDPTDGDARGEPAIRARTSGPSVDRPAKRATEMTAEGLVTPVEAFHR
jgi:hypothetical protein